MYSGSYLLSSLWDQDTLITLTKPNDNNKTFFNVCYCNFEQIGPRQSDHNKQLITLTVITGGWS
jgi:hypothetical protein